MEDHNLYEELYEKTGKYYFDKLLEITNSTGEVLEGNIISCGDANNVNMLLSEKRYNLFSIARKAKYIMEIGFNAGHSALIYLLANNSSKIQFFDIGYHRYSKLCYDFLDREFPGRLSIMWGDSLVTVPIFHTYIKYDLIHIDGGHSTEIAYGDIMNCKRFTHPDSIIIFDDTETEHLYDMLRTMFTNGQLKQVLLPYYTIYHVGFKYT